MKDGARCAVAGVRKPPRNEPAGDGARRGRGLGYGDYMSGALSSPISVGAFFLAFGIGIVTVRQFEAAVHQPRRATLEVVKRAFEAAGIEFIDANNGGAGVRLTDAHADRN